MSDHEEAKKEMFRNRNAVFSKYAAIEKELWEQMDAVVGTNEDMDLIEIIKTIDDENFLEELDREDMILGLSGVDADAIARAKTRRANIEDIKKREEKIKKDREKALKIMIEKRERKHEEELKKQLSVYQS